MVGFVGASGLLITSCNVWTALLTHVSRNLCCGWLAAATVRTAQSIDVPWALDHGSKHLQKFSVW